MFLITGVLFLILILLLLVHWYYVVYYKFDSLSHLPGPTPIPVIGALPPKNPYEIFKIFVKRQEIYGNIYKTFVGSQIRVVTTHVGIVQSLLSSNDNLDKSDLYHPLKPFIEDGLIVSPKKKWKERRRLMTPTFHFQIMDRFLKTFNVTTDILIEKLRKKAGKGSFDIFPFTNVFALDLILETAMGIKLNAQENPSMPYALAIDQFLTIVLERGFSFWKIYYPLYKLFAKTSGQLKETLNTLHGFSRYVITERKKERQQNRIVPVQKDDGTKEQFALLDTLLNADKVLSNDDINEELNNFLLAGHDTINTSLTFALLNLARNKDIQDKLYEEIVSVIGTENTELSLSQLGEMKYLEMVIKETLRIAPPIPLIERQLNQEFVCEGITFPKDSIISIFIYGLHMDPEIYPDPEKFDPERFSIENLRKRSAYAHIPFSAGSRNCIGQRYALVELKCTLSKLIQAFEFELADGYKEDLFMIGLLKTTNGIQLKVKPRNVGKNK